jgi:ribosomal-protein-alanine N-acetyltransferase
MHENHLDDVETIERETSPTPWSASTFLSEINSPTHILLVANTNNEVVGFTGGQVIGDELHIHSLAVTEGFRRQSIGRQLINELINRSALRDATKATLEVRVSNEAARNLYVSCGFEESGIRPKYYRDNGEDAVIMWLHAFEVTS